MLFSVDSFLFRAFSASNKSLTLTWGRCPGYYISRLWRLDKYRLGSERLLLVRPACYRKRFRTNVCCLPWARFDTFEPDAYFREVSASDQQPDPSRDLSLRSRQDTVDSNE